MTCEAMAAGTNCGEEAFTAGEFNGALDVFEVGASHDDRRMLIDGVIRNSSQFALPSLAA